MRMGWRLLGLLLATGVVLVMLVACSEEPPPAPTPTMRPTLTPSPYESLDESRYVISLDDTVVGLEELHLGESDGQLVVYSELYYQESSPAVARRSTVLSTALYPQSYELEYSLLGARSTWIAAREGEALSCLANNLDWYAPVVVREIRPEPRLLLEGAPSALPYAVLALQYDQLVDSAQSPYRIHWLDVTEDLPQSRPISITLAARQGAVIGTTAFEAFGAGDEPLFSMWVRPASRALFGVEVAQFEPGLWQSEQHPTWPESGRLEIERVSAFPEATPMAENEPLARQETLLFESTDGETLAGVLMLPEGEGPFPCLVLHAADGLVGRRDIEITWLDEGWALFRYDKRGLGESEGRYERDRLEQLGGRRAAGRSDAGGECGRRR